MPTFTRGDVKQFPATLIYDPAAATPITDPASTELSVVSAAPRIIQTNVPAGDDAEVYAKVHPDAGYTLLTTIAGAGAGLTWQVYTMDPRYNFVQVKRKTGGGGADFLVYAQL